MRAKHARKGRQGILTGANHLFQSDLDHHLPTEDTCWISFPFFLSVVHSRACNVFGFLGSRLPYILCLPCSSGLGSWRRD